MQIFSLRILAVFLMVFALAWGVSRAGANSFDQPVMQIDPVDPGAMSIQTVPGSDLSTIMQNEPGDQGTIPFQAVPESEAPKTAAATAVYTYLYFQNTSTGANYGWQVDGASVRGSGSLPGVSDLNWQAVCRGDFNGDGKRDLLWRHQTSGMLYIWFMDAFTITSQASPGTVADTNWQIVGVGDFNGDGKSDILWRNASTGTIYVWLMNGTSIIGQGSPGSVADTKWQVVGAMRYFNGDGKADILWWNASTGAIIIWFMNGATISSSGSPGGVSDLNWKLVGTSDFNGDGISDLLWQNTSSGMIYIWLLNSGASIIGQGSPGTVSDANWQIPGLGDFNNDGKADILWRNTSTNLVYLWMLNGTSLAGQGSLGTVTSDWQMVPTCPKQTTAGGRTITNTLGQKFVLIPAGTFTMGSPTSEAGRDSGETQHQVTLTKPFYIMTTEVTLGQWKAVMGQSPSRLLSCSDGDNCPVTYVSWTEVQSFIKALNTREGTNKYRLPTEAEWEKAARGGSSTAFYNGGITNKYCGGSLDPKLDLIGWYCGNSPSSIRPVAQKQANAYGLYDMSGNAIEWVQDTYGSYPTGSVTDPTGPPDGYVRVLRGGSFCSTPAYCRSASREFAGWTKLEIYVGFRLARTQ